MERIGSADPVKATFIPSPPLVCPNASKGKPTTEALGRLPMKK
jgi:hypothetical protein